MLQDKILELQNATSSQKNGIKQHADRISKNNFGLDPKNPDEKKKIDQAQKVLANLQVQIQNCDTNIKNLSELDKHSMAISKYEAKTCK